VAPTAEGSAVLKVQVTAAPESGKANDALVKLLAKAWGMPRSALSIVSGATDRNKTLAVTGEPEALRAHLGTWLAKLDGDNA
jgi:uncharacterized protein YggU (UPF0235/DUF167 family)